MIALSHIGYVGFVMTLLVWIPVPPAAQRQAAKIEVRGEVKDERGAVIVKAKVSLTNSAGDVRNTTSDEQGHFHFGGLAIGKYVLSVMAEGFAVYEATHEVDGSSGAGFLSVTLYPQTISETVAVGNDAGNNLDPEHAAGTQTLSAREIEVLPDDPTELRQQLQILATSSGSVPGGATVTVDGFVTGGKLPPKSSMRSVRINPDLFSAEYDTPPWRGGLIEVFTKPGADAFHGSVFFNFNNSKLNARNAFALNRGPSRTERYGGQIGGPIVRRRAGFFLDLESRNIDEESTVHALVLDAQLQPAIFIANVLMPLRLLLGSARADWQLSPVHTFVARYDLNDSRSRNQDVGGLNLPERLLRSHNINAPVVETDVDPLLAPRPFGGSQNVLSSGRQRGRVLFVGLFQPTNKRFTLASGYLNFAYGTNADTPFMLPQSSYSENGEWARPFWMSRHQLFLSSTISLPLSLRGSLVANAASGTPFNITTGRDNNADGAFNDRPTATELQNPHAISTVYGVLDPTSVNGNLPRNAGTNPATVTLDFNLARTFVVGKRAKKTEGGYKLMINARASNLLNRTNLLGLNGVLSSPFFGRANASGPARRIEIGVRINF